MARLLAAHHIWSWADQVLITSLYNDGFVPMQYTLNKPGYVATFARRFGAVRLRQLRSKARQCHMFKRTGYVPPGYNPVCYSNYNLNTDGIRSLLVPLPELRSQKAFLDRLSQLTAIAQRLKDNHSKQRGLQVAILNRVWGE